VKWRRVGFVLPLAALLSAPDASALAEPPRLVFHIGSGPLTDALAAFSRQSGVQLLFTPADVQGRRASAVIGTLDPRRALTRLLAGTGLIARRVPGGATLLVPMPVTRSQRILEAVPRQVEQTPMPLATANDDIVVVGTAGGGVQARDVAFAATGIDRIALDRVAAQNPAEALRLVPGVTIETSGGKNGANIFVRGYPSGGDAEYVTFQTEGVAFFPPATLSFLENSQLYRVDETVERIETVRSGTGALFGTGQPGLTVNLVQREGGDRLAGVLKVGTGTDDEARADAFVSGPLDERTRFMIGGYYSRGPGVRSPGFDADRGGQVTLNLRRTGASGSLLLFARYLNDRSQWLLPIPIVQHGRHLSAYPGFDAGTSTLAGPDTRRGVLDDGMPYDLSDGRGARIVNLGLNLERHIGFGLVLRNKLSWLAGHADTMGLVSGANPPESAVDYAASLGGSVGSLVTVANRHPVSPDQALVEAGIWKVSKRIEALVNDASLEWKSGVSTASVGFYAARYSSRDMWDIGNDLLLTATPHAERLDLILADGRVVTRNGFTSGASFRVNARYAGTDLAFYATDELALTDRLRVDGGVRHQRHDVDGRIADLASVGRGGSDGDPRTLFDNADVVFTGSSTALRYRRDAWSWTVGANYAPTDALGTFARFSSGISFPFFDNLRDGIDVAPRVDTVEGGLKLTTPRLSLRGTLFHNAFHGLVTTVIAQSAPIASIGGARATGLEVEGAWRPAGPVTVTFTTTWLDAHYRDFFTDDGATDLSGNRVQRQPRWLARVMPAWEGALAKLPTTLFSAVTYTGDRWSDIQNRQLLPRFVTLDAGATVDISARLRLQVNADNLLNAIGLTEGNPRLVGGQGDGAVFARVILGRSVRLSARWRL
jgi:outer membrane receptor protein involved in Fe transport